MGQVILCVGKQICFESKRYLVKILCEPKKETMYFSNQREIDLFAFLYYCYKRRGIGI